MPTAGMSMLSETHEVDASYDFDAVIEFDYDVEAEELLEVEYRTWINVFEDAFPEAELYYPEPADHL